LEEGANFEVPVYVIFSIILLFPNILIVCSLRVRDEISLLAKGLEGAQTLGEVEIQWRR
jgi:hypothetical protein